MTDLTATLAERGARYGKFEDHAMIAQGLKDQMWATEGWSRLAPDQRQALEVIQDKVARILNGDPDYTDNWHDIAGYSRLVEDRLNERAADAAKKRKNAMNSGPMSSRPSTNARGSSGRAASVLCRRVRALTWNTVTGKCITANRQLSGAAPMRGTTSA